MMKKLTALLLALCLIFGCTSAMADTAQARLNQKIATRTGPGTNYTEPGTFLSQGNYVTVHTRVWDSRNEIWWVQVEFTSGGYRYRAYTGSWRMSVDLSRVPQERSLGTVRVTANTCVYAGPGWDYKMWDNTVSSGTTATLLEVENGYGHIECWNSAKGRYWRVWALLSNLSCRNQYSSYDDTYPSWGSPSYSNSPSYNNGNNSCAWISTGVLNPGKRAVVPSHVKSGKL